MPGTLRDIFVDFNSFFASVEQQCRPELRGRPVGVVPVMAETTCCIAASYEAKAFGVKTGTAVWQARQMCPGIHFVEADHERYVRFHHRAAAAIETCLHVTAVHSIDEVSCRLMGREVQPETAVALARKIKQTLLKDLGPCMRCSVGIAPNVWLAKVAADMQKPDGLTLIEPHELPCKLYGLKLQDLPGIGARMDVRLARRGITSVQQLGSLGEADLCRVFESRVMGRLWWQRLRGEDLGSAPPVRRSVGHSRILSPDLRTDADARKFTACMLHKAAARMRSIGYWAGALDLSVSFLDAPRLHRSVELEPTRDTLTLLAVFSRLWEPLGRRTPIKVGVVLGDLRPNSAVASPLFESRRNLDRLADTMDRLNSKYGRDCLYFADIHGAPDRVPLKIAFNHVPALSDEEGDPE